MAGVLTLFGATAISFLVGYLLGWGHGRSSGKVAALEIAHDIDLSSNGGDD